MRDTNRSRAIAYRSNDALWLLPLLFALVALAALPALAQDAPGAQRPGELSDEAVTADVPDDQVKKVTIDGEGVAEVLDVDEVGTAGEIVVPESAPPEATEAPSVVRTRGDDSAQAPSTSMNWEERLERDLRERIQQDPLIGADSVDIESKQGEVTLSGSVATLSGKNRAGELARMMRGVQYVENNLQVRPTDLEDTTVEQYVQAALQQERSLARNDIAVSVENGQATIAGMVDSWQEKNLAEEVAAQARGVVAVTSRLEVARPESERAEDKQIAQRVQQRLRSDPWVASEDVDVAVNDGEVMLSGSVHSLAQRERAFANAWVQDVESVDISALRVIPADQAGGEEAQQDEQQPQRRQAPDAMTPLTNEEIQQAILDTYNYSPRIGEFRPTVTVDNGVVVLEGTASTVHTKNLAEQLAKNVRGVWSVENRIDVATEKQFTDTELADKIREALDNHPDLSRLKVAVTVMEGAAYLSGSVESPYQVREAADAAATVPGVTTVYNEVNLSEAVALQDDFELKQDIESAMYWSPYVDLDDVDVTVTNGVATLTGTVERWASRLAAEDAAQQMGAVQVNNRLRVLEGPAELRAQAPQMAPVVNENIVQE